MNYDEIKEGRVYHYQMMTVGGKRTGHGEVIEKYRTAKRNLRKIIIHDKASNKSVTCSPNQVLRPYTK